MLALGEALDPARRLHLIAPRGPLRSGRRPAGTGIWCPAWATRPRHLLRRLPAARRPARRALAAHRHRARTHRARRILDGHGDELRARPRCGAPSAGRDPRLLRLHPSVEGWRADLEDRAGTAVFIAHGRNDPVIDVEFARRARQELEAGGLQVSYRESDGAHDIDARDSTPPASGSAQGLTRGAQRSRAEPLTSASACLPCPPRGARARCNRTCRSPV